MNRLNIGEIQDNERERVLIAHRRFCLTDSPREAWCHRCPKHAEHEVELRAGGTMTLCDRHFADPMFTDLFVAVRVAP